MESLVAVLAVVMVRRFSTKLLARNLPEPGEAAASLRPDLLRLLERKPGWPASGWTNRNVLITTTRLGEFMARKGDGLPGGKTIWRGWQRLLWMREGVQLMKT